MAADFEADTAAFSRAAARMRSAPKELQRDLAAALKKTGKPLGDWTALKGASKMPRRGGLQAELADASVTVTVTIGENPRARIKIASKKKRNLDALDRGVLRHPVYPKPDEPRDEWTWVEQAVPPNAYTDAFQAGADPVVREIIKTVDEFADRIESEL